MLNADQTHLFGIPVEGRFRRERGEGGRDGERERETKSNCNFGASVEWFRVLGKIALCVAALSQVDIEQASGECPWMLLRTSDLHNLRRTQLELETVE